MSTIDDVIASARLPERVVRVCLRRDLISQHEVLSAELDGMKDWNPSHFAEADPRVPLAEAITALEDEMHESETLFRFRALSRRRFVELQEAHPHPGDGAFNAATFPQALIAACSVEPEMGVHDVERLFDVVESGVVETLFAAVWGLNAGVTRVPFSATASDVTKRHETS